MNCDSCEEPKNSFSAATTGRMLMIVCGVIVSTSSVVIRSRTPRPPPAAAGERDDVLGREHAGALGDADVETLVELVAADLRQVVALGVEEERPQEVARVVERGRLAGALLLEHLDQGLFLARGRVLLERHRDEGRVAEELQDILVRRGVGPESASWG